MVARELFTAEAGTVWSVSSLARAIGVSLSVASYAVRDLAERDLIEVAKRGKRIRITRPDRRALLEEWGREYDWRENPVLPVRTSVESIRRFLFRIRGELAEVRWAVTLHAGASVMATRSSVENIHIYVDAASETDLWHLARNLGWKHAPEGTLHLLLPHYRTSVWSRMADVQGVPVVSRLQLILDLWNHPDRGREVAEGLMEEDAPEVTPPSGPPPGSPGSPSEPGAP